MGKQVWILTKGTDIDTPTTLGVYATLANGLSALATEARILHNTFGCDCEETAEHHGPSIHAENAHRDQDGSVRLEHHGDWLSLAPHQVIGTTRP